MDEVAREIGIRTFTLFFIFLRTKATLISPRLANGGDYLFQAHDEEQLNLWVNGINQQAQDDARVS